VRGGLSDKDPRDVKPEDRIFAHVGWIQGMADLVPTETSAQREDLEAALLIQVDALERAGQLEHAVKVVQHLLQLTPDPSEYLSRAASIHFNIASRELEQIKSNDGKRERVLRSAITELHSLQQSYQPNLSLLQAEAALHQILAIHLANTDRISQALVESRTALTLNPYIEEGEENYKKLTELMAQLQEQMEKVSNELREGNRQLSPAGAKLMADSSLGFGPLQDFVQSSEYRELTVLCHDALAFHLWRTAGLRDVDADKSRRDGLLNIVSEVIADSPEATAALDQSWEEARVRHQDLMEPESKAGLEYVRRRLFPDDPTVSPAPNTARIPAISVGPSIPTGTASPAQDREPFGAWLYSPCDLRIKAQCILAVVLLILAMSLGVRDAINRTIRSDAYIEARHASVAFDPKTVMDSTATFLQHPVLGKDVRQDQMARMYDEALVTWIVWDNPPEDEIQHRIDQRRSMMQADRRD
jgi:tetratricopeptide (TPR) repeat protein